MEDLILTERERKKKGKESKGKEQKLVCSYPSRAFSGETRSIAHISVSQHDYLAYFSPIWSIVNAILSSHACRHNHSPYSPKWMSGPSFSRILPMMAWLKEEGIFCYFGKVFSSTHILFNFSRNHFISWRTHRLKLWIINLKGRDADKCQTMHGKFEISIRPSNQKLKWWNILFISESSYHSNGEKGKKSGN